MSLVAPPRSATVNKRGHVFNAALLSVGIAVVLRPELDRETVLSVLAVGVPVTLGALAPDVDTAVGRHRKTLHNLPLLAGIVAFPWYFDNLHLVWVGVATHYVLDVVGTTRGIALLYPIWDREFSVPVGVPVDSRWAPLVVLLVTAAEVAVVAVAVHELPAVSIEYGRRVLPGSGVVG